MDKTITRREFVATTACAGLHFAVAESFGSPASGRPARIAVDGLGCLGLAQIRALCELDEVQIVGLADPSRDRLSRALRVLRDVGRPAPITVADGSDIASACRADVVVISTPDLLHTAHAEAALRRGCHVVVDSLPVRYLSEWNHLLRVARQGRRELHVYAPWRVDLEKQDRVEAEPGTILGRIRVVTESPRVQRDRAAYDKRPTPVGCRIPEGWVDGLACGSGPFSGSAFELLDAFCQLAQPGEPVAVFAAGSAGRRAGWRNVPRELAAAVRFDTGAGLSVEAASKHRAANWPEATDHLILQHGRQATVRHALPPSGTHDSVPSARTRAPLDTPDRRFWERFFAGLSGEDRSIAQANSFDLPVRLSLAILAANELGETLPAVRGEAAESLIDECLRAAREDSRRVLAAAGCPIPSGIRSADGAKTATLA